MKKQALAGALVSICLILVFAMAASNPAQAAQRDYLLASTHSASGSYPHVVKVAEIWSKKTPYNITVVESGATYDNINRMMRGELKLGYLVTLVAAHTAYKGIERFKGKKPFTKIRMLYNYCVPPIFWCVRADSGITNIQQLSGKPYGAGIAGASSTAMVFHTYKALGMDDSKLEAGKLGDLVSGVIDNRLVGVTKACGNVQLDAALLQIKAATPIRILSLTKEQWDKFNVSDPLNQWVRYDQPANTLTAVPGHPPIITQGFITSVIASSEVPQEVGHTLMKVAVENWKEWGSLFKATLYYDPIKDQLKGWPPAPHIPLHAGSVQYLKERGVDVPKEFIPPEYRGR